MISTYCLTIRAVRPTACRTNQDVVEFMLPAIRFTVRFVKWSDDDFMVCFRLLLCKIER